MKKDIEQMDERRLLSELANRVIAYDKATDAYIVKLENMLTKNGIDYESARWYESAHMKRDDRFCRVREVLRVVKKDPNLLHC